MKNEMINKIINNYRTPAYFFDINILENRINYLRNKLPSKVELCYAIKANPFIVKEIEKLIYRYEVCSPGEYQICKESNIDSKKIIISGVYKNEEFINKIVLEDKNIESYTIESKEQFEIIKSLNKKIKVLIRITSGNQFGINDFDAEEIIKKRHEYENIEIKGIQFFSGTQKKSIKNLKRELDFLQNFIKKMKEKHNYQAKELEYGPGFPIQYFKNEEFDEENFLDEFTEIINSLDIDSKIILEIGRSIVASCGTYITKIVDIKVNKGQNYAILDGGMNHIVYYGQSMAMKIPKCEIFPKRDNNEKMWNLCGALCTTNDILVKQFPAGEIKIGDFLIFNNVGAYCMTEGISLFLSRNLPYVFKITKNNNIKMVRKNLPTYKFNM